MKNKLFDPQMFNQPWLMGETDLDAVIKSAQMISGDELAAVLLKRQTTDKNPPPYTVKNGVAVIHIRGTLSKESYYWSYYSNNTTIRTFDDLINAVAAADADPDVDKKVLDIDCNGSMVAGCFETVSALNKSAQIKPIFTYANSNMKSGGMLIGSVGQTIAAPKTAEIGSIGVRTVHYDESGLNERIGLRVTHLTAGKYKAMGNPDEPLSAEAKDYFQSRLDTTYSLFVDVVAVNRDMPVKDVLTAADGKVFLGEEAKKNGLIDLIVDDLDSFIETIIKEDTQMDLTELKTKHQGLYDQVRSAALAEGQTVAEGEAATRITEAETNTRVCVIGIVTALAGKEMGDKVQKLVDSGLTADQLSAVQGIITPAAADIPDSQVTDQTGVAAVDAASRAAILAGLKATGNPAIPGGAPPAGAETDFMADVEVHMEAKSVSKTKAMAALRAKSPEMNAKYETWIASKQK